MQLLAYLKIAKKIFFRKVYFHRLAIAKCTFNWEILLLFDLPSLISLEMTSFWWKFSTSVGKLKFKAEIFIKWKIISPFHVHATTRERKLSSLILNCIYILDWKPWKFFFFVTCLNKKLFYRIFGLQFLRKISPKYLFWPVCCLNRSKMLPTSVGNNFSFKLSHTYNLIQTTGKSCLLFSHSWRFHLKLLSLSVVWWCLVELGDGGVRSKWIH